MSKHFGQAVEDRRSIYAIGKKSPITDQEIQNIVEHSVKYVPSAFNSQSARAVILLGKEHDKLWENTRESLRKVVPEANFAATDEKIQSFQNGYGTILFYEDQAVVEYLQENYALYADNFPIWSLQSSGMLQFTVWAALEAEGLGVNLQHYTPLIEDQVRAELKLPDKWKLLAQMPFGLPLASPEEKNFAPIEDRVRVFS
jgi:uncharacterized protein